jgi:hypothetical protein
MISVGFQRVSKNVVSICGKPLLAAFRETKVLPICMRTSTGARGLSRNGGNIHVHPEIPFITIRPTIKRLISQSILPAPLEIRDAVFQELIRISLASNYTKELVAGAGGLLSRGLIEDDATRYGAKQDAQSSLGILNDYVRALTSP